MLVGREEELRPVAALLEEARRGRGGALAVAGEPGVGKTALLEEARRLAADMQVLAATGVESESELPFASLHELLRPLLALLPRIPVSQARALAAALALEEGDPNTLAVGAGTLSLLAEASEQVPLLVVLDDAHWLDRSSADALVFAARRLRAEQVAVLAAFRPGSAPAFEPLPRLELGPLAQDDARSLLRTRAKPVAAADEARLLAAAAGNPLALLELPVELAHEFPAATTAHEHLQRAFGQRLDAMPRGARLGLLLAAAEPDTGAVRRAAESQRLDASLAPAEAADLIRIHDGTVSFRHPVVRSLVYANAMTDERTAAHRALADALPDEADRDRRAWHLGAAAEGPDETIAALLEETAERAAARGGYAAQARALTRAALLSPSPADRARRLLGAARAEFWSGDATRARELAEEGLQLADDPLLHADLLQQVVAIAGIVGELLPETVMLRELERVRALDTERSAKLLRAVVLERLNTFDAAGAASLAPELETLARGAGPWWGPRALATAAAAHLMAGERDRAIALFRELVAEPAMPGNYAFGYMYIELIDLEWWDEVRSSLAETLHEARTSGNLLRVVWDQCCTAFLELHQGRLASAETAAVEAIQLGEALGVFGWAAYAYTSLASIQAWRGEADACATNARMAMSAAREFRDRRLEGLSHQALAHLALGERRSDEAVSLLEPVSRRWVESTVAEPALVPFVPDLIEAYALSKAADDARQLLGHFAPLAEASGSSWARAAAARSEGLLVPDNAFDAPFGRALGILESTPLELELARTRLAFGERLRRAGRRREARVQLQAAHRAFAAVEATPWQKRAADELRATGVRVGAAPPRRPDLTPQELQIAGLVAEGKSNKEIAAAIYLSPKTVEYHLANMFRKLDIHSRAELARIMARGDAGDGVQAIDVEREHARLGRIW